MDAAELFFTPAIELSEDDMLSLGMQMASAVVLVAQGLCHWNWDCKVNGGLGERLPKALSHLVISVPMAQPPRHQHRRPGGRPCGLLPCSSSLLISRPAACSERRSGRPKPPTDVTQCVLCICQHRAAAHLDQLLKAGQARGLRLGVVDVSQLQLTP
jgi:hypothetical protein